MAIFPELKDFPNRPSPIEPLTLPVFPFKRRLKRNFKIPRKFDFDKQRYQFGSFEAPKIIPFRRGRYGRIIMLEDVA